VIVRAVLRLAFANTWQRLITLCHRVKLPEKASDRTTLGPERPCTASSKQSRTAKEDPATRCAAAPAAEARALAAVSRRYSSASILRFEAVLRRR
jgi:hypothetical protein